jgi:dUTPase
MKMEKEKKDKKEKLMRVDRLRFIRIKALGKFKKPEVAKKDSIGYDLYVPECVSVPAKSRVLVPLNFAIELPRGIEGKIEPRSGFSAKGMEGLGSRKKWVLKWGWLPWRITESGKLRFDADVLVGKIDPGYKDCVNVILKNNDVAFTIPAGTRIAQLTFYRVLHVKRFAEAEELDGYDRGGGIGHTGTGEIRNEQTDNTQTDERPVAH